MESLGSTSPSLEGVNSYSSLLPEEEGESKAQTSDKTRAYQEEQEGVGVDLRVGCFPERMAD